MCMQLTLISITVQKSFHVGLSNAFVLTVLKRQYCVRTSVYASLASVKHISRCQEVVSSVCAGLLRGSVFSVRMVEKIIFVQLERLKKPQKKKLELE